MKRLTTINGAALYVSAYELSFKAHTSARRARYQAARALLRSAGWWV